MRRLHRSLSLLLVLQACGDDHPPATALDAGTDASIDSAIDGGPPGEVPPDPATDAVDRLVAGSTGPVSVSFAGGFPTALSTRFRVEGTDRVARARDFVESFPELYGQDRVRARITVRRSASEARDRVVFHQTLDGFEVHAAELAIVLEADEVVGAMGRLLRPGDPGLERPIEATLAGITGEEAEMIIRMRLGLGDAPRLVTPELVIADRALLDSTVDSAPRLAWRVGVGDTVHLLDARDGELLWSDSPARPFDMQIRRRNASGDEPVVADEIGCLPALPAGGSCGAVEQTIHDGLSAAWVLYMGQLGWDSMNGDGSFIDAETNTDETTNAQYRYNAFGEWVQFTDAFADVDVAGHELTHGVVHHTSDLEYKFVSGALNESFADFFGALVEGDVDTRWEDPTRSDLLIRDDVAGLSPIRSLCYPTDFGQPAHRDDWYFTDESDDNGGVHTNSGVPNLVWCTYAEWLAGGELALLDDAMRSRLVHVAFSALTMLPSNANLAAARTASVLATLQGGDPEQPFFEYCGMLRAWAGVGAGAPIQYPPGFPNPCLLDENQDSDGDFISDAEDNCLFINNPTQLDLDEDGIGNVCDDDVDGDGLANDHDGCILFPDPSDTDTDGDGTPDVCDADIDDDGWLDESDNCVYVPNFDQADSDEDGEGDACDPDPDHDDVWGLDDVCPFTTNPGQEDADGDGLGDACDPCPAGADELVAWTTGITALGIEPAPIVSDLDGDGVSDGCDPHPLTPTTVMVDGAPATAISLAPDAAARRVSIALDRGAGWVPLPACSPPCDESWDEQRRVVVELAGLAASVTVSLIDERGRLWATAPDRGAPTRTLGFRPRGGRRYRLFFSAAGMTEVTATLTSRSAPAERPDPARACDGARDGTPCPMTAGTMPSSESGICVGARCALPRCGDGVRSAEEACDDGNAASGDGCEPGTCLTSCSAPADCDDADVCTTDSCGAGGCAHALLDVDGDTQAATSLGRCGTDCDDTRADVHAGQSAWFVEPRCTAGAGCRAPFDYDCSGADERRWVALATPCATSGSGCVGDGWVTPPGLPGCREGGRYQTCTRAGRTCTATVGSLPQECH